MVDVTELAGRNILGNSSCVCRVGFCVSTVQGGVLDKHCAGWDFVGVGLLRRLIVCLDWLPHTTATAELREIVRPRSTDNHHQATIVAKLSLQLPLDEQLYLQLFVRPA